MANVYLKDSTLSAIGDAIRSKTGGTGLLLPSQMPAAIQSITTGGSSGGGDLDVDTYYLNIVKTTDTAYLWSDWETYFPTDNDFDRIVDMVFIWGSGSKTIYVPITTIRNIYSATGGYNEVELTAKQLSYNNIVDCYVYFRRASSGKTPGVRAGTTTGSIGANGTAGAVAFTLKKG